MPKRESPKNRAKNRSMSDVMSEVARKTKILFRKPLATRMTPKTASEAYKQR